MLDFTPVPGHMIVNRETFEEMTRRKQKGRKTELIDNSPSIDELEEQKHQMRKSEPIAGIRQMYFAVPDPYSANSKMVNTVYHDEVDDKEED